MPQPLPDPILPGQPWTALAPMQDVTTLPFMSVVARYGAPDYFFTEYFRVHAQSTLEKHILASITENRTGRPVFAQLIGEDLQHMERTVKLLLQHPVAGIDLNMGCPAPKVYKKNVGGGLLRDPVKIDQLLACMRAACPGLFTVKMRIGFEDTRHFETILELVNKHRVDLLSLHGRTVKEMYRSEVHYDFIARAKQVVRCPLFANGNITSARKAEQVVAETQANGVMIGRSAIRNPWIFRQCREHFAGQPVFQPCLADVREYVDLLWQSFFDDSVPELRRVNHMKKFLIFVGQGVDSEGEFLHHMRRSTSAQELFQVCDQYLIHEGRGQSPFAAEPHAHLVARPNRECAL